MNIATVNMDGLKDFTKAEEMYRLALGVYERSLGKEHEDTKRCARNLAMTCCVYLKSKEKVREVVKAYPFVLSDPKAGPIISEFLSGGERA